MDFKALFELPGFAALFSLLVNVAKRLGWVPDGYAGLVAAIGDILIYAAVVIGGLYEADLTHWDGIAAMLATLLAMLIGSWVSHAVGRKMNLPGYKERA